MTAESDAAVNSSASPGGVASLSELKQLGKYQIERKIGAGGMGTVFLARDSELKRTVALKVLPQDKAANPTLVRRFRAEAQAAAQLRHPNIVAVYDSGEADGYLYIAMEFVDGRDLFEMVALRGVVPIRRSIDIIKQVAAALQHAYEQNIVHRDIKPSNLLIRRDGVVKLTDLGLARSVDDTLETNITRAGTTVGTVDYMSPEQARNSKFADIRSDLYSLGCTWYQMLTGSPPYPDGSVTNKLQAHAIKPIPDPRDKNPRIPEGLTAVIRRMMAKKPEDRYQTPAELIDELEHAKLTDAAISRQIFADLSDEDSGNPAANLSDDELGDDSYFDLDAPRDVPPAGQPDQVTPDQVIARRSHDRSANSPQRAKSTEHARSTESSRNAESARTAEPGESPPRRTARSKVAETEDSPRPSARSRETPKSADPEPDEEARRSRPRPGAPEAAQRPDTRSPTADTKPRPPRVPGQKPMPPKRQPVADESDSSTPWLSADLLKTLCAVAGLVLVIVGIGWIISRYSQNVTVVAPPPELVPEQPPVQNPATAPGTETENPPAVVAGTPEATRPDSPSFPAFDVEKTPDWAQATVPTTELTVLIVGPGPKEKARFSTLAEALAAVPADGAVIRLQGPGPFPLPRVELPRSRRVVIAADGDRPVVALIPAEGQTTAGLILQNGSLELRGIHFTIDRQVLPEAVTVVDVEDGQLRLHECSFTSTGEAATPALAVLVQSSTDASTIPRLEPQLLLDQVLVRGAGFAGVAIRRASVDAVIRNSLLVTGTAPAVELAGSVTPGVTDVVQGKPRRIVRILQTTLSSQGRVFDLSVASGNPPPTAIVVRDSLVTALGTAPSVIASAARWTQTRSTTESWLSRMTWTSSNSLYLGFAELIDLGSSYKVVDATAWQRVWNSKSDVRQFQKLAFPESVLEDLSTLLPQDFDSKGLSYQEVKSSDGGLPGCRTTKLVVPDVTSHQRAVALGTRPALPQVLLKPTEPVQVRKVDLKKEDLGVVLNRGDWPSGTQFEATGSGIHTMTPARIENKNVRVVFRQADGVPLRIQHQGKSPAGALFTISGGTLELTQGTLEHITGAKATDWLIQAMNSTVILNGCRLQGIEQDAGKPLGLVAWATAIGKGGADPALVIRDSFLAGAGTGVRAEIGRGPIIVRNSIVAIRGDALDLRPLRSETPGALDLDHVTVSATRAALRVESPTGAEPVAIPFRMFVERTVFAPPLSFRTGDNSASTVLEYAGPVREQNLVDWWGASNGVSWQVPHFVRKADDTGAASDARTGVTAWKGHWDKGHDIRLLTGDKGVYLAGELPLRWRDLKPATFSLHPDCQGITWAEGGRAIGANAQQVEETSLARKADTAKPVSPVQSKKNVGF